MPHAKHFEHLNYYRHHVIAPKSAQCDLESKSTNVVDKASFLYFEMKENSVGRLLTGDGTFNQVRLCWYSLKICSHFLHSDILRQNDSQRPTGMLDD